MENSTMVDKLKRATEVVCKQGMVQFPVSATAIAIIGRVVGDNEEELDLIYACFGCGVCSRFCPEEAISLKEGLRRIFIMPPRLRNAQLRHLTSG